MSRDTGPFHMSSTCVRLRPDASVEALTIGESFWAELGRGEFGNFQNEYLVTTQSFAQHWPMWEMHPMGDEIIVLLSGSVELILEKQNGHRVLALNNAGEWVLVPKGVWHTARVSTPSTVLFITAGEGTLHRPVDIFA